MLFLTNNTKENNPNKHFCTFLHKITAWHIMKSESLWHAQAMKIKTHYRNQICSKSIQT